jgi:hypothetical protein
MFEEYFSRIAKGCCRTSAGEITSSTPVRRCVLLQITVRSRALTPAAQDLASLLNRCVREFRQGISDFPEALQDIGKCENEKPCVEPIPMKPYLMFALPDSRGSDRCR